MEILRLDTGLRKEQKELQPIQPIVDIKGEDYYKNGGTHFRDNLKKCIEEQKSKGNDIMNKIKVSYDSLFNKTGVQPNAVMITPDYLSEVIARCLGEYRAVNMKPDQLWGLDVIVIKGNETVKACIINKEE